MTRTMLAIAAALLASAAFAAAQGPASGQDMEEPQRDRLGTVTYTGCLEAGARPGQYVLANATPAAARGANGPAASAPAAPSARGSESGSSAARGAGGQGARGAATPERFLLNGNPEGFDLRAHLHHRIQVTGEIAGTGEGRNIANDSRGITGARAGVGLRSITVQRAQMVSSSCGA